MLDGTYGLQALSVQSHVYPRRMSLQRSPGSGFFLKAKVALEGFPGSAKKGPRRHWKQAPSPQRAHRQEEARHISAGMSVDAPSDLEVDFFIVGFGSSMG
jgi:hypothetical protein